MRGEKQENMVESNDYLDPVRQIPVFSLYGNVRRPTPDMIDSFDILLVDLQDVGCRIYTYLTSLFYVMEACAGKKGVWVLDRPNPAGRPVEGIRLDMKYESFVGAAPLPMRHGLTLGEAGLWYLKHKNLDLDFRVIKMNGYNPLEKPHYGWPINQLPWVNPSPNIPRLTCARMYAGTVLLEGTNLSEGRGTTTPLELMGAPGLDIERLLDKMVKTEPRWIKGCTLRPCYFEPTFHKFHGRLCSGLQIHIDLDHYDHQGFRPVRLTSLFLKIFKRLYEDFDLWREPPYEYISDRLPIDILSGNSELRQWVEDPSAEPGDWDARMAKDEKSWTEEREDFLLY